MESPVIKRDIAGSRINDDGIHRSAGRELQGILILRKRIEMTIFGQDIHKYSLENRHIILVTSIEESKKGSLSRGSCGNSTSGVGKGLAIDEKVLWLMVDCAPHNCARNGVRDTGWNAGIVPICHGIMQCYVNFTEKEENFICIGFPRIHLSGCKVLFYGTV
jgi:hypothetical protein